MGNHHPYSKPPSSKLPPCDVIRDTSPCQAALPRPRFLHTQDTLPARLPAVAGLASFHCNSRERVCFRTCHHSYFPLLRFFSVLARIKPAHRCLSAATPSILAQRQSLPHRHCTDPHSAPQLSHTYSRYQFRSRVISPHDFRSISSKLVINRTWLVLLEFKDHRSVSKRS